MNVSVDPPAPMTAEQKALIQEEDRIRNLFAEQPNHTDISDPHVMLMNVFENESKFDYAPETPEEILTQKRRRDLTGRAIVNKQKFLDTFAEFTQGVFNGLDWNNVFVAGGAVLGAAVSEDTGYRSSDIDIFLYGITDEAVANEKTVVANTNGGNGDVVRTHRAITILNAYPYRHVQIILRLYKSPAEVLMGFDIDSCCIGYDGTDVWCMERFRRALTKRFNLVNISRRSLTYETRLLKYSKRGFAVAVPDLDKSRVDVGAIVNKMPKDVQGLSKLLLFDIIENKGPNVRSGMLRKQRIAAEKDEGSDYNADLHVPWGPGWKNSTIISMMEVKNRAKFFSSLGQPNKPKFDHLLKSNAQKLQGAYFDRWSRSLDNKEVQQPIEWVKENPAYQDFDNGFKRLMTGSFEPVVDENWNKGVYHQSGTYTGLTDLMSKNDSDITTHAQSQQQSLSSFGFGGGIAKKAAMKSSVYTTSVKRAAARKPVHKVLKVIAPKKVLAPKKMIASKKVPKPKKAPMKRTKPAKEKKTVTFGSFGANPTAVLGFGTTSNPQHLTGTLAAGAPAFGGNYAATGSARPYSFGMGRKGMDQVQVQPTQPSGGFGSGVASGGFNMQSVASGGFSAQSTQSGVPHLIISAFGPQPGAAFASPLKFGSKLNQPGMGYPGSPAQPAQPQPQPQPPSQRLPQLQQHIPTPSFSSVAAAPGNASSFSAVAAAPGNVPSFSTSLSRALLLVSLLIRKGYLTKDERGVIKDLIISRNEAVFAALEVFEIDQDTDELADTWWRIVELQKK